MKNLSLVILFSLILSVTAFSQDDTVKYDENDLYQKALLAVMQKRLNDYGKIIPGEDFQRVTIYKTSKIIIIPNKIENFEIEYFYYQDLLNKFNSYKKTRKKDERDSIPIMEIYPMVNKGNKLEIRFTDSWFSKKENVNYFGLEGGSIVTFTYDCKTKKFIIENVELWGI